MSTEIRTASGMRPTGPLHLGHYFGVLKNWVDLQDKLRAFFFVADWHALTTDFNRTEALRENTIEMVKDWIGSGLDPEKCTIFRQSDLKEHAELSLLLSMITPVSWVERNPTYKEQQQQITTKDLSCTGFLCYPILMAADILMYKPQGVPVGEDQLPHMELTREIARRFNGLYGDYFPEPQAMLTPACKCPGLDGRKMSKSYNNGIFLRDSFDDIEPKIKTMFTYPPRVKNPIPAIPMPATSSRITRSWPPLKNRPRSARTAKTRASAACSARRSSCSTCTSSSIPCRSAAAGCPTMMSWASSRPATPKPASSPPKPWKTCAGS